MIEYYLGEVPILANVETYRLEDPEVCAWALDRLDQLVFKPVDGSGGKGIVIGPAAERGDARRPAGEGARRPARLDRAGAGRAVDRADVRRRADGRPPPRPAPVRGERRRDVWVVPGGLTRVALPAGSLIVNSSQGGGSKDTWVLAAADRGPRGLARRRAAPRRRRPMPSAAPALGPLPEQDSQQQQQQ